MRKIFLALFTLCFASSSFSYDASGSWTTIEYIYSPVVGRPFITFGAGSLPGCFQDRGAFLPTDMGDATMRTYSTILAAYAAKKPIKIYFNRNSVADDYTGWGLCDIEAVNLH